MKILAVVTFIYVIKKVMDSKMTSNNLSQNKCVYKGKNIFIPSQIIKLDIKKIIRDNTGAFFYECLYENNSVIIKNQQNNISENYVWAIDTILNEDNHLFSMSPVQFLSDITPLLENTDEGKTISFEQAQKINHKIEKLYKIRAILLVLALFTLDNISVLSLVLSAICVYITNAFIPFENWTKINENSIIKVHKENISNESTKVVQKKDTSDTEDELSRIEEKLMASVNDAFSAESRTPENSNVLSDKKNVAEASEPDVVRKNNKVKRRRNSQ